MNTAECSTKWPTRCPTASLQWSRRVNTAECGEDVSPEEINEICASMEPPCEHGGVQLHGDSDRTGRGASMEPPCEHGGVLLNVRREKR